MSKKNKATGFREKSFKGLGLMMIRQKPIDYYTKKGLGIQSDPSNPNINMFATHIIV